MPRKTKPPEERKVELIDAAERLFSAKGYGETAVSDIVHDLQCRSGDVLLLLQIERGHPEGRHRA